MSFFQKDEQRHLYIKPRSLLIFSEEARYIWEHSISLRKIDRVEDNVYFRKRRVSLTFRKIRNGECNCIYVNHCDSQIKKLGSTIPLSDFNINLNLNSENKGK
jgi:alkylated DNA repair protein alkB family protein 8